MTLCVTLRYSKVLFLLEIHLYKFCFFWPFSKLYITPCFRTGSGFACSCGSVCFFFFPTDGRAGVCEFWDSVSDIYSALFVRRRPFSGGLGQARPIAREERLWVANGLSFIIDKTKKSIQLNC